MNTRLALLFVLGCLGVVALELRAGCELLWQSLIVGAYGAPVEVTGEGDPEVTAGFTGDLAGEVTGERHEAPTALVPANRELWADWLVAASTMQRAASPARALWSSSLGHEHVVCPGEHPYDLVARAGELRQRVSAAAPPSEVRP